MAILRQYRAQLRSNPSAFVLTHKFEFNSECSVFVHVFPFLAEMKRNAKETCKSEQLSAKIVVNSFVFAFNCALSTVLHGY
jgi:hypothetical protein